MITEVFVPQLTSTMEEGIIADWLKSEGDEVEDGEPLVNIETDKAIMEIEAPASGVLLKILMPEGEVCAVLTPIGLIGDPDDDVSQYTPGQAAPEAARAEPAPATVAAPQVSATTEGITASPRARRLAAELGVELNTVTGTGPGGRIVEEDVRHAAAALAPGVAPLTGMRKAVASQMVKSKQQAPHFYLTSRMDMTAAAELLADLKPQYAEQGVKLTYTALVTKAVALALRAVPALNAHCTDDGVRLLPEINVGVAVAAREGIVVPTIHNTDKCTLLEVARSIQDLAERARSSALPSDAFADRSFTVSSLGAYPVDDFTAIINPPEVGILAVGRVRDEAVAYEGDIHIRPQITVTLSADHRAVDGVVGAQFLEEFEKALLSPEDLL